MKKILVIIALLFCSTVALEASSSYIVEEKPINSVYTAKADAEERVDYSQSTDENRIENKSGQTALRVTTTSTNCAQNEYEVAEIVDGHIQFVGCEVYFDDAKELADDWFNDNTNGIILKNGEIIFAERAIAYTTGGYNYIGMIYPTVTEAYNSENGITISGGAYDMAYYGTTEYKGKIYYEVMVGGLHGYIDANEAELLPEEFIKSQSYYQNIDGQLVYYSTYNPLKENAYTSMVLGETSTLKEGVKYYSYDDINFSEENIYSEGPKPMQTAVMTDYTYWQWLPLRSTSNYTAADYKEYLKYIGCDDGNPNTGATSSCGNTNESITAGQSEYYNYTNGFVQAEDVYAINSTMLFAMANHESAYGTSGYARKCHNFFGWAAYDSDPDKACSVENNGVDFSEDNQIDDAIMAQSINLSSYFLDVTDFRYYGMHVGNKTTGINVTYASDPNWGKHIASMAYDIDTTLGGLETGYYRLAKTNSNAEFYQYSNSTSPYQVTDNYDGDSTYNTYTYTQKRGGISNSTSNYTEMPVVITGEANGRYKVTIPTPVKQSSSESCKFVDASSGYMPNYSGYDNINVPTGAANFSCTYSWDLEYAWVNKSEVSIINDVPIKEMNSSYVLNEYPQEVLMKTNKDNVVTYYGSTIKYAGTVMPVTHAISDTDGNLFGYVVNTNPSHDTFDVVRVSDVTNITASDTESLGWTNNATLNSTNMKVMNEASTTSTQLDTIQYDNTAVTIDGSVNGQTINGNKLWNKVVYNPLANSKGYSSDYYMTTYKPTTYVGYDKNAYIDSSGNVYLDGYAYIKYMNSSNVDQITKTIQIKDANGNVVHSYIPNDTTKYKSTTDGHEEGVYNYDYASYTATINVANLDLAPGTYTFYMGIDQGAEYVNTPLTVKNGYTYDETINVGTQTIRLYTSNNTLKIEVKENKNVELVNSGKTLKLDDNGNMTIEGYAYQKYFNVPSSSSISHKLQFIDSQGNVDNTTNVSSTNKYAGLMESGHEEGVYNYDYSGYMGSINLPSLGLAPDTYSINILVSSQGYGSSEQIEMQHSFDKTINTGGKIYHLYTSNNKLMLEVTNNSSANLINSGKSISLDSSGNMKIEGYAYQEYSYLPSSDKIYHKVQFVDSHGNVDNTTKISNTNKYAGLMADGHENGKYNYDYSGYTGTINLPSLNLAPDTYTLSMYVSSQGSTSSEPIQMQNSFDKTINSGGKIYHLYTSNNKLMLEVTNNSSVYLINSGKNVSLDASGNMKIEGYAYQKYSYLPSSDKVYHKVQFVDSQGNTDNTTKISNTNKYAGLMADGHEEGKYNYDYSGYTGTINLPNLHLSPDTYTINMYVSSQGSTSTEAIQMQNAYDKTVTVSGYKYHLYTENGYLKLEVKAI